MSELQQQAPHALERILDLIDTMPDGREHTFVPCADLRLLRTAFADLLAERDEARSSLALLQAQVLDARAERERDILARGAL